MCNILSVLRNNPILEYYLHTCKSLQCHYNIYVFNESLKFNFFSSK